MHTCNFYIHVVKLKFPDSIEIVMKKVQNSKNFHHYLWHWLFTWHLLQMRFCVLVSYFQKMQIISLNNFIEVINLLLVRLLLTMSKWMNLWMLH